MNQPQIISPGQRWTFISRPGRTVDFIVAATEHADIPEAQGPTSIVSLRSEATGRYATITHYWLRRQASLGGHRWEYAGECS